MLTVAQFDRPLGYIHVAEPGFDPAPLPGMEALTLCGLIMAGLWLPVEVRHGDALCPLCCAPGRRKLREDDRQLALWEA